MKFIHRLAYYLSGFAIGIVFLLFFFSGKKTSCDYGMDARVKKNIRLKKLIITDEVLIQFEQNHIDTLAISALLYRGDVKFKKSNTSLDSCKEYHIEGNYDEQKIGMRFANCDSIAKVLKVFFLTE